MLKKDRLLIAQLLFLPLIAFFATGFVFGDADPALFMGIVVAAFYLFLLVKRLVEHGTKLFSLEDPEEKQE